MNYTTDFKSIRAEVSAEEWQTRVDLAACYRLVDKYAMTDLIYSHITARIPGSKDHLLINLYGMLYKEITASSLVKIDVEGEIIWKPETDYGINKSGYVIHGAIHRARPDVACVLHTHTRAGIAVSAIKCGLLPLSQTAIRFVGHIGYHDYEGPAVELDERERIVSDLGPHDALVMRNHGLLTCGATIQQAFKPCISSNCPAARRSTPWRRAPSSSCRARTCSRIPRISISPARAARMACWNGRRCCACSRPRTATRAIRRIGTSEAVSTQRGQYR
jgi:ribulose-5-phosphate 4-epimerase/fuculose-1-phosphate aldolase